jgi:hypothetical protein
MIAFLRSALVILLITLTIDFCVTQFIPNRYLDVLIAAKERDAGVYRYDVPWHHDLMPNVERVRRWGPAEYGYKSDKDGFRTGRCADTPLDKDNTVFVIGDSFVEGMGVEFEQSVEGLLACAWQKQGKTVRNLGAASYSPAVYWRKLAGVAQRLGVKPKEIVIFLDMSDIRNDALDYVERPDGSLANLATDSRYRFIDPLKRNFTSIALVIQMRELWRSTFPPERRVTDNILSRWTHHEGDQKEWALRGLEVAAGNLGKAAKLCQEWACRLTLVVYPWPDQIDAGQNGPGKESLQVTYWRDWSAKNGVRFVNAFPGFFTIPAGEAIKRYYIPSDTHYSVEGNKVLFDQVWDVVGKP